MYRAVIPWHVLLIETVCAEHVVLSIASLAFSIRAYTVQSSVRLRHYSS